MQKHPLKLAVVSSALFIASLLTCSDAFAQCCPGGGGAPQTTSGLGQASPRAIDLAPDPQWQVYEFERGGIRYTQINDSAGKVRAAVGRIDGVFWVMPIGADADRVLLSDVPAFGQRKVLYRTSEIEVVLHRSTVGDYWEVHQPDAQ